MQIYKDKRIVFGILVFTILVNFFGYNIDKIYSPVSLADDKNVNSILQQCRIDKIPMMDSGPLRFWSICFSKYAFGNPEIIATLFSYANVVLVFFLARSTLKSNQLALLSAVIFENLNLFQLYGFTSTHTQDWVTLFLSSLVISRTRNYQLSFIPFAVGLFFHVSTLLYLPILWLLGPRKMSWNILCGLVGSAIGTYIMLNGTLLVYHFNIGLQPVKNWFSALSIEWYLVPILTYLALKCRQNIITLSLLYITSSALIINIITDLGQYSYRMMPLAVFVSIGIAYLVYVVGYNHKVSAMESVSSGQYETLERQGAASSS